jgi:hypothetical protein
MITLTFITKFKSLLHQLYVLHVSYCHVLLEPDNIILFSDILGNIVIERGDSLKIIYIS